MFIEDFVSRVKGHDDMMWLGETRRTSPVERRSCVLDVWGWTIIVPSATVDEMDWDGLCTLIMDAAVTKTRRRRDRHATATAEETQAQESGG